MAALGAVLLLMIPVAVFFSGAMLAVGLFSRNAREANSYLQPLLFIAILPALAPLLPGVELKPGLAPVPVLNVSLLSKELLSGTHNWTHIALVFGSTSLYAAAALTAAVKLLQRENVLSDPEGPGRYCRGHRGVSRLPSAVDGRKIYGLSIPGMAL